MDKVKARKIISDLRMGVMAFGVVTSVGEVNAGNDVEQKRDLLNQGAVEAIIKNDNLFEGLNREQIEQIANLHFEGEELFYLTDNKAISMKDEYGFDEKVKKDTEHDKQMFESRSKKVNYQEIVLNTPDFDVELGNYNRITKEVTVNKVRLDLKGSYSEEEIAQAKDKMTKINSDVVSESVATHEGRHLWCDMQGSNEYDKGVKELAKTKENEEVAANIDQIFNARKLYKEAVKDNPNAKIDDFVMPSHSFYADAVKGGRINPLSDDKKDKLAELSFIVNETQRWWEKNRLERYSGSLEGQAKDWINGGASHAMQPNPENYKKTVDKFYQYEVDGVNMNLAPLLKRDIQFSPEMEKSFDEMQKREAPIDKKFVDFTKENIKNKDDLLKVQGAAKDYLKDDSKKATYVIDWSKEQGR